MKNFLLGSFLMLLVTVQAIAQERTVTGVVTDNDDNGSLPGVSVRVKGAQTGTISGPDGKYVINVSGSPTLVFTYIGYNSQEVVVGEKTTINIALVSVSNQLSEVVVTALGQKREQRSLGYSVGEIKSENVTFSKSNDITSSLAGKVAGVQLVGTPSSSFGNATATIRGANTLGSSANVDGSGTDAVGQYASSAGVLYVIDGTVTSQQNVQMDNVENISVLKGAAATALYGNRAANGVILITTKKGSRTQEPKIELNLSAAFENQYLIPPYQNEYAGGYTSAYGSQNTLGAGYLDAEGFYIFNYDPAIHPAEWASFNGQRILEYGADESWGPRINGQPYRPYYSWYPGADFGQVIPLMAQPDNVKSFFNTGANYNNSIAFSGGGEKYVYRFSYANQNRTLVLPNTRRDQHQLGLSGSFDLSNKISVSTDIAYTYNNQKGTPTEGYRNDGLNVPQNFNQWWQRQINMDELKNYRNADGTLKSWNIGDPNVSGDPGVFLTSQYWDSPYFVQENEFGLIKENRLVGNVGFNYKFNEFLNLQTNARLSYTNGNEDFRYASGGLQTDEYRIQQRIISENNYEAALNYRQTFGQISFDGFIGGNIRNNLFDRVYQQTQGGLSSPNFFDIGASIARPVNTRTYQKKIVRSLYGKTSFGYKGFLYLDATLRNDWSSALPSNDNSYLYSSVSTSFLFSELIKNQGIKNVLTLGKLRGSYAQVGSDLDPYRVNIDILNRDIFGTDPAAEIGNEYRTGLVKPALTKSWEAGLDLRFFNRVGLEFTYYQDDNTDQILSLDVDPTTGFSFYQINAGNIQRKGFELAILGTPVRTKNFTWEATATLSRNRSIVEELSGGLNNYLVGTTWNDTRLEHRVGQEWGVLVGRKWRRNEQGQVVVGANGLPLFDINQERGSVQPDYTGGFYNTFAFKGLSLAFSLDFRSGGLFYSSTKQFNLGTGLSEYTVGVNDRGVDWREYPSAGGGIRIDGVTANGQPNNVYIPARNYYYTSLQRNAIDEFALDASYLKLREVRLGYDLPSRLFANTPMKNANLGFFVSNPWLIAAPAKKYGIDPSELEVYWNEGGQLLSTRTFGLNLKVGF